MKVYVNGPYNGVTKIEFCCDDMAKDILLGVVTTRPWTDHALGFWVRDDDKWGGYRLSHCGHCGAEIKGECFSPSGEDIVTMPKEISAENGAKKALIGEFFEEVEVENPDYCDCGECEICLSGEQKETLIQKVPVSWTTIKAIYKKTVECCQV